MIELRQAKPGELSGTAGKGEWQLVCVEDDALTGYVACSIVKNGDGLDAFLHDLAYTGQNAAVPPMLLSRAFKWLEDQGHPIFYANVSASAPNVFDMCMKRGEIHQVTFRMEVPRHAH